MPSAAIQIASCAAITRLRTASGVDRCTMVSSATAEMEFRKPASASSAAADASHGAAPMAPSATAAEPAPQISDGSSPRRATTRRATSDPISDPAAQPETMIP